MKHLVSSGPQASYLAGLTLTQWKHVFVKRPHVLFCQFVGLNVIFPFSPFSHCFLFSFHSLFSCWPSFRLLTSLSGFHFSFCCFHIFSKSLDYDKVMLVDGRILPDTEARFTHVMLFTLKQSFGSKCVIKFSDYDRQISQQSTNLLRRLSQEMKKKTREKSFQTKWGPQARTG